MNKQVVSLLFFAAPLGLPAGPGVPRSDARLSPDQAEHSSLVVEICNPEVLSKVEIVTLCVGSM